MAHEQRAEVTLLQALRFDYGLSLDRVARETQVSHKTLSNLERGLTAKPTAAVLSRLAAYYGISASELLDDLRARRRERDDDTPVAA